MASYSGTFGDSQFTYRLDLEGASVDGLIVLKVEMTERLSSPYSCRVWLEAPSPLGSGVLGASGALQVTTPIGTMKASGFVKSLARDDLSVNPSGTRIPYEIEIVPALAGLVYTSGSTVFGSDSAVKVDDLIRLKLGSIRNNINFVSSMPKRDFVVQYNESDFNFIQRITEHYGVYYYFEFDEEGENVKFIDSNELAPDLSLGDGNEIRYNRNFDLDSTTTPVVKSFRSQMSTVFGSVVLRDYDPEKPDIKEKQAPVTGGNRGQKTEYGALVETVDDDRRFLANVRAEEIQSNKEIFTAICNVPQLRPGLKFKLTGPAAVEGDYLAVAAVHMLSANPDGGTRRGVGSYNYQNTVQCIQASIPFRPRRETPKPAAGGLFTAVVDGAGSGDSAQIDNDGRYRVRLHLDSNTAAQQEKASKPMRRVQPYAGPNDTGLHMPLLRGTEVVVACINGDIDQPVIVGAVANPATPNVSALGNKTVNRLRTPSGSIFEIGDGTTDSTNGKAVTHAPFLRIGAPSTRSNAASGSYLRLGATVTDEKNFYSPLSFTKHSVSSSTNPVPEIDQDWIDILSGKGGDIDEAVAGIVGAAQDAQDAGTDKATGASKALAPKSEAIADSSAATAPASEAIVSESDAKNKDGTIKAGYVEVTPATNPKTYRKEGYTAVTENNQTVYVRPGFTQSGASGEYLRPSYKDLGNGNYLRPGFVENGDGTYSKNKSSQIELQTISLKKESETFPDHSGIFAHTDKDFVAKIDGGAIVQVGKGKHLKMMDGDLQVAVDQGALFLGASSGIDMRAGSAAVPANIALTAYGYIKQDAKGPVSEFNYSTKDTTTYGSSKDVFYGTKYSEFHGSSTSISYGTSDSQFYGHKSDLFIGTKTSINLSAEASINLSAKTQLLLGASLTLELAASIKLSLAVVVEIKLSAEFKINIGFAWSYTLGTTIATVNGLKAETINGVAMKTAQIDMKKVLLTIEWVDFAMKNTPATVNKEEIKAELENMGLKFGAASIVTKQLNLFT